MNQMRGAESYWDKHKRFDNLVWSVGKNGMAVTRYERTHFHSNKYNSFPANSREVNCNGNFYNYKVK